MNRLIWFSKCTDAVIVQCPVCGKNYYIHRNQGDHGNLFAVETAPPCEHIEITQNEHEFKINVCDTIIQEL